MTDLSSPKPPTFGDLPLRCVARVTIMFTTPFAISSGRSMGSGAAEVMSDANGLPAIPATSMVGALRHAFEDRLIVDGVSEADAALEAGKLFGPPVDVDGTASPLSVSSAHIHDADDRPVDGLVAPNDRRLADPVLENARKGLRRDRVRLSHRGMSDGRGKFEERMVAAGHRFTFDMTLRGDETVKPGWRLILGLLQDPDLRLGGGTRRGRGGFEVLRLSGRTFDLRDPEDYAAYAAVPAALDAPSTLPGLEAKAEDARPSVTITLRDLHADGPWLFGGGPPEGNEGMAPVVEPQVRWEKDHGHVDEAPVHYVPATSLKGALAHRLAWHYNRLTGTFAVKDRDLEQHVGAANRAVRALLGCVEQSSQAAGGEVGRRGWLVLDDIYLSARAASEEVHHVSLDRFSGGARSGLLFSERVLDPVALRTDYTLTVIPTLAPYDEDDADVRRALRATLDDIRRGRLSFGGGTGRGNGRLRCAAVEWSDGGTWIDSGQLRAPSRGRAA